MIEQTQTEQQAPGELTDFQKWASAAAEAPSSEAEIDTASEIVPASEPENKAAEETEERPSKGKGLKKRFAALTTQIRELQTQLAAKSPAAAAEPGVATSQNSEQAAKPDETGKPVAANFDTYEEYVEALTDWKLEKREAFRQHKEAAETRSATVKAQVEAVRAKYTDYDQVVTNDVTISQPMADVMVASEHGAELAYYLGKHRTEAANIAKMSPAQAGAALARIEAKLNLEPSGTPAAQPKPANTTKAPKPPKTISGTGGAVDSEPDPKDFAKWAKWKDRQERRERGD